MHRCYHRRGTFILRRIGGPFLQLDSTKTLLAILLCCRHHSGPTGGGTMDRVGKMAIVHVIMVMHRTPIGKLSVYDNSVHEKMYQILINIGVFL